MLVEGKRQLGNMLLGKVECTTSSPGSSSSEMPVQLHCLLHKKRVPVNSLPTASTYLVTWETASEEIKNNDVIAVSVKEAATDSYRLTSLTILLCKTLEQILRGKNNKLSGNK